MTASVDISMFDRRTYLLRWVDSHQNQQTWQRFATRAEAREFIDKHLQPRWDNYGREYTITWILERVPHVIDAGVQPMPERVTS